MANKIKTRFDSANLNKNKVATLVGVKTPETIYQDLLEFKVEHNGIEMPLFKLLSNVFDELDRLTEVEKRLVGELSLATQQLELQKQALLALDSRLKTIEERGNI